MKTFISFLIGCSFVFCSTFAVQAEAAKGLTSIGFQFCPTGNCSKKVSTPVCGENAELVNDKCVCLSGFSGDGFLCEEVQSDCPVGSYMEEGWDECCYDGQKYDLTKGACVACSAGQSCHCPLEAPYADGKGDCVECLSGDQCPSGSCSKNVCCPEFSSVYEQNGRPLKNGCYCQKGYMPDEEKGACVPAACSQVENSSPTGKGDPTSLEGCFCEINYPHWKNGRCMRARDCTALMEGYGFKKDIDFVEPYKKDDQTFLNTIYVAKSFKTPSDMNLTGCNLWVDGNFQNRHKLIVDSLQLNFSNFVYDEHHDASNIGTIITKGLTASKFSNSGLIHAPEATVTFGYLENRGQMIVDSIYELNESPATMKNFGSMSVINDFLFGVMSPEGSIQNFKTISVGGDWDSNDVYNRGVITVRKQMNKENCKIYNEGQISVKQK